MDRWHVSPTAQPPQRYVELPNIPDAENNLDDSVVLELTVYPVESPEACEFPGSIAGHTSWYTGPMF